LYRRLGGPQGRSGQLKIGNISLRNINLGHFLFEIENNTATSRNTLNFVTEAKQAFNVFRGYVNLSNTKLILPALIAE
jgi:hypothetical protein